ncbi:DNA/RNA non-specific endonuclease [Bacillus cereus]|uniref:Endonuclease n=1 Tax=Bacillus cereus TaxID=1396 RepID=A0A2B9E3X2_BACCE|nr:DNA/RNA non-specific endonuclease [Bacillus cereus]PGM94041.1 endonuclease [Bacillus cereus]
MSNMGFEKDLLFNQNLIALQQQQAQNRYIERSNKRENLQNELQHKNPLEVSKPERAFFRKAIINPRDGLAIERIIGGSDLFPISYFEAGLKAAKPVCRIEVRDRIGRVRGHGTGFLVSPSLLLTNNHVLTDEDDALFSLAQFDYELGLDLKEKEIKNFRLAPNRFFMTNERLDFTLVAVEETSADGTKLSNFNFLPLLSRKGGILVGEHLSIIQHPSGAPKMVANRENKILDIFDDFIHYETDTEPGSSGSAVYNDEWIVIALHHAGVPDPKDSTKYIANEGIRISSIVQFVMNQSQNLSDDKKKLLDELAKGWELVEDNSEILSSERLALDWYKGSKGYDSKFLGDNYEVPHPKLRSDLEADVALPNSGERILNYTHFSIVMSQSRRLAYYTVVNLDGNKLVDLGRNDSWVFDSRIDQKYQCGPELYARNEIDRGHLVRRLDPVWGDLAKKAERDTFHFTNCSPQHKNLNQKTWLDLEDYILEKASKFKFKATVFTGPVFRSDDIVYRGVQIPAEFWKVAVMVKEDGKLSATAYLQSQKHLIDNLEDAYGAYKTYQVPVLKIEDLTGLDFGELRNYDPIAHVEGLIGHVIESPEDIKI